MKMYKSTKISKAFLLALMVTIFMGCTKKKERHYELLPPDPEMEMDLTELAVKLTVNYENSAGAGGAEGSRKLIDNDISTKFLINPYKTDFFIQQQFDIAQRIDAYTITSGNDASGRDPKNWTIEASNDSATWVKLDERTDQKWSDRKVTNRYEFTNATDYKFYRWYIKANNGDGLFQASEWRIIRRPKQ